MIIIIPWRQWQIADSYTEDDIIYAWDEDQGVKFLGDVELSQFDLISSPYRNASISRKRGTTADCSLWLEEIYIQIESPRPRALLGAPSEFQSAQKARILSDPSLCTMHPNRGLVVGLFLAQPWSNEWSSQSR